MKKFVIYFCCYLFLLYDNYLVPPGLRIFDFLGWGIMYFALCMGWLNLKYQFSTKVSISLFMVMPIVMVGILNGVLLKSPSVIPFILGLISFIILSHSETLKENLYGVVKSLLIIISLVMIVQFILFQITGEMQSFLYFRDEELRIGGGLIKRPTGLYIEPGQHTSAVILLLTLYGTMKEKIDWVTCLSAVSLVVSMSFAGMAGILLYFFFMGLRGNKNKVFYFIFFGVAVCLILFFLSFVDSYQSLLFDRVDRMNEGKDGSFRDRLVLLSEFSCHKWMIKNSFLSPLFGGGISSDMYTGDCGANNISWALFSFGYIGTLIILGTFLVKYWRYPLFIMGVIYIGIANLNASFAFFWFWLAATVLIISVYNDDKTLRYSR